MTSPGVGRGRESCALAVVGEGMARDAAGVVLGPLVGVEQDGGHPGLPSPVDVAVHVVAHVQDVFGGDLHAGRGGLEEAPVGLAIPMITGHDDRVEVAEQADPVNSARAFAPCPSVITASGKRVRSTSSTRRTCG